MVILIGVARLAQICAALVEHGRDPQTPAAIVEQGTTPYQRVIAGTLVDLPALAAAASVQSPATIVVGEVVRLREQLAWFTPPAESSVADSVPKYFHVGVAVAPCHAEQQRGV